MNKLFDHWLEANGDWTESSLVIKSNQSHSVDDNGKYIWITVEELKRTKKGKAEGILRHKKSQGQGWYELSPDDPNCEDSIQTINNVPVWCLQNLVCAISFVFEAVSLFF